MVLRVTLLLLMVAGLAGFGAVAWTSMHPTLPQEAVQQPVVKPRVLAAARVLRPGVLLQPNDLTAVDLAQADVPPGASLDTPAGRAALLGAMIRRTVAAGEPLVPAQVMHAGDRGFLAAVLEPGRRAITVGVDAVSGTAGLIWPGDHVDLILTETLNDPETPMGRRIAGETVLHNVRVIAIDQELMQGATGNTPNGGASQESRTVTLEVSPENAERVAVASRLGHLSLSVISADTPVAAATQASVAAAASAPVTWGGDVSAALQSSRKTEPSAGTLRLYEGGAEGKEVHF